MDGAPIKATVECAGLRLCIASSRIRRTRESSRNRTIRTREGAITFLPPRLPRYPALAVVWSVAFPTLVRVSDRLIVFPGVGDRYRRLS
jgi:hypothetical protein